METAVVLYAVHSHSAYLHGEHFPLIHYRCSVVVVSRTLRTYCTQTSLLSFWALHDDDEEDESEG